MKKVSKITAALLSASMLFGAAAIAPAGAAEVKAFGDGAELLPDSSVGADVAVRKTELYGTTYYYSEYEDMGEDFIKIVGVETDGEDVYIPYTLDGKYVVELSSLGDKAEYDSLKSLYVEYGVLIIGAGCIERQPGMTEIYFPDSIIYVGSGIPRNISEYWENGVYYIGNHAIGMKEGLERLTVRKGTVTLAEDFTNGDGGTLKSISLPDSLYSIGKNALDDCINLKSVTVPGSVTLIGQRGLGYLGYYNKDFVIKGIKGTAAESYANAYGIPFKEDASLMLPAPLINYGGSAVVNGGIKVAWYGLSGAQLYRLYAKENGKWVKVADTDKTYYTDKNVKAGKTRTYTIKCLTKAGKSKSGYYKEGFQITYVAPPVLSSAVSVSEGIKISWKASSGAKNYRVFRKDGSGSWKRLADTTKTSYTDSAVASGKSYTYTVRCISEDGYSYVSSYNSKGITGKFKSGKLSVPKISRLESVNGGMKISWGTVAGAQLYRVYIKRGGKWLKLGDTKSTSYTDPNVTAGESYTYTVKCITTAGKSASGYDSAGKTARHIAAPKLKEIKNTANGVLISWEAPEGAENFRVFYKGSNGSWKRLGDTAGTSITDVNVESGVSYTYTVRGISADGESYISGYDAKGISGTFISVPAHLRANVVNTGIKLSWDEVGGASRYRVFCLTDDGAVPLGDTTTNSFIDNTIEYWYSRTYTVCCVSADGKTCLTECSEQSVTARYR